MVYPLVREQDIHRYMVHRGALRKKPLVTEAQSWKAMTEMDIQFRHRAREPRRQEWRLIDHRVLRVL